MIIPHSRPLIQKDDIKAVTKVLASGHMSQGEEVRRFEKKIAEFVGVKYGVAVSSGTSAIHLALRALGIGYEDEVIIPSYVCTSPYMATLHAGATPKIVDISLSDFNICADEAKKRISEKTKAIIVPHMFGAPAELDKLLELKIPLVEDLAQSLGAEYHGHKVGSLGQVAICSFYATKMIATGEGGIVLTNDAEINEKILETREYDKKSLDVVRYNYKMTDLQAALGLVQLKKLPYFIKRRREIAEIYNEGFSEHQIKRNIMEPGKKPVYYRYVVLTRKLDQVQEMAKKKGIMCEKPVQEPIHQGLLSVECPNSDYVHSSALSVPLYPSLSRPEIEYVVDSLEKILERIV